MILEFILLQASGEGGSAWTSWLMLALIFVVFYFFMIRPQRKKQKELEEQRKTMREGDKVVTSGGLHGKIKRVKDATFLVEVAKDVCIEIDKTSCFLAESQQTPSNSADTKAEEK